MREWSFTIPGDPVGKPRMTRRDRWAQRPPVLKYRAWADMARLCAPRDLPPSPLEIHVRAYLSIPDSWSKTRQAIAAGEWHRQKPDADNILKSVCDALFPEDKAIARKFIEKRYADDNGPRVVVTVVDF